MRCKEGKPCTLNSCPSKRGLDEKKCLTSTYVLEPVHNAFNRSVITEKDLVILRPSTNSSAFIHCPGRGKSVCKYSVSECGMPGEFDIETCKYNILTLQLHTNKDTNSTYPLVTLRFQNDQKTVWLGCNREGKRKCKRFSCDNHQQCSPDIYELVSL